MSKESMKTLRSMKNKRKQISIIVGLWLAVILVITMFARSNLQNLTSVDELGNGLEELRSALYFDTQYRIAHAEDIALKIQLVYSLRIQLETNYQQGFFQPDIEHLLFTTDRFIELVKQFNGTEVELMALVDQLKSTRESYSQRPEIQDLYYQLSSRVFEAMFSSSSASPEIYRSLDSIFAHSQTMDSLDGEKLQKALAQTSSVLGSYAKGSYLVERLVNHPVNILQLQLKMQFNELERYYFFIAIFVSAIALFFLSLITIKKESVEVSETFYEEPRLATDSPVSGQVRVQVESELVTNPSQLNKVKTPNAPIVNEESVSKESVSKRSVDKQTASPTAASSSSLPASEARTMDIPEVEPYELEKLNNQNVDVVASSEVSIDYMLNTLNGDKESVLMLLGVFIEDHENDAKMLPELLESDIEHAMRKVHSLKGVSANLGAAPLKDISMSIEEDLKNEIKVTDQKLERLVIELLSTIESAKRYIESQ
ncbi:Hpt domain-containing protein [Vibrio sp. ZSDE26]|uniref:Hpt domain-containing protein n=1 Tax=Vibrio amylolyticus TaxID=2847292 RepID=A0A9X2BFV6_9VIBR|nr:Hpt domain-containing protein [Vibrio amylolyticus]MCK6262114.1 Hpt domain-containing protein [Vibrio amylolyticus]